MRTPSFVVAAPGAPAVTLAEFNSMANALTSAATVAPEPNAMLFAIDAFAFLPTAVLSAADAVACEPTLTELFPVASAPNPTATLSVAPDVSAPSPKVTQFVPELVWVLSP